MERIKMNSPLNIFIALTIIILPNSLFAGKEIDNTLRDQCKYTVYGNLEGSNNDQAAGYLLGYVQGIEYMTDKTDLTEFFTSRNYRMIIERSCENALKNSTEKGFQLDYKREAYKLISIKAEAL
jgi:hypothetical protein